MNQPNQLSKPFIVVAEDDQFYANVYKIKLAKEGFDVAVVANGEWALKVIRSHKPDLVLLDLLMPVKDGISTLEDIRNDAILKDVKVIVLSNSAHNEHIKRARELGISDYLVKTNVSIEEVIALIKKQLIP